MKVKIHPQKIIAQSTTEPIMWGGYQFPKFLRDKDDIYIKFSGRPDSASSYGKDEEKDPVYVSKDMGETWTLSTLKDWENKANILPNGDRFEFKAYPVIKDFEKFPHLSNERKCGEINYAFTIDEVKDILGEKIAKTFRALRTKKGETTPQIEECNVNWDNMPTTFYNDAEPFFVRLFPASTRTIKVDKNNTLWTTVYTYGFDENKKLLSRRVCLHILKSDDFGHNWDYVSTIPYDEKFSPEGGIGVEGFNETTIEFLADGSMLTIFRSGSLDFRFKDYEIPKLYYAKSFDEGKTWTEPAVFYDYGVCPASSRINDTTLVMASGRPGVYIRFCTDPKGEKWDDVIELLHVPEEDFYTAYYEYSCSNVDILVYDEKTLFATYSDFTHNTPEGERAKSIVVQKITL